MLAISASLTVMPYFSSTVATIFATSADSAPRSSTKRSLSFTFRLPSCIPTSFLISSIDTVDMSSPARRIHKIRFLRIMYLIIVCFQCGGCMTDSIKGTLFLKHTQFVITWPDGKRQVVPVVSETLRIGRGSENNDIPIPPEFQSISRRHIEIRREGKNYRLVDLGSSNGVYVNGQKVENVFLKDGDEIRIGEVNDKQEVQILFQMGTEFLTSTEVSERATIPPTSSLSSVIPENIPYLSLRFPNGQVSYFPIQQPITVVGRSAD